MRNTLTNINCGFCRKKAYDYWQACYLCLRNLNRLINTKTCQGCGLGLTTGENCTGCLQNKKRYWKFFFSPFWYDGLWRISILKLKYDRHGIDMARLLAMHFMIQLVLQGQYPSMKKSTYLMVPVPMHWKRAWQKGYNHAALLTSVLAEHMQIKKNWYALKRVGKNKQQQGLVRKDRLINVRNNFQVNQVLVKDRHIILVDDVITTLSTVNECARCLLKAGASDVTVWSMAQTSNPYTA